jgi:hypothetical protein
LITDSLGFYRHSHKTAQHPNLTRAMKSSNSSSPLNIWFL